MTAPTQARHALIFGATGLIGRNLALRLIRDGVQVTAATRSASSERALEGWLRAHDVDENTAAYARVDFDDPLLLPGGASAWSRITEIHNCAGAYRFGMTPDEARAANVATVERIVDFAARLPDLRRLVHVSGYRVGGQDPSSVPWSSERAHRAARELGAYEASKVEADAVIQARATNHGIPWTLVNPSTVIGDSTTGESDQQIGLASSLTALWRGDLPVLPGDDSTFVPVVTADHLAEFMGSLAADPRSAGRSYWILADDTPPLPRLLADVGRHYRVRVPRIRIPVGLVRRLPTAVTRADPETLTFLSSDRYPTAAAQEHARDHGVHLPDTAASIERWADHLAAHRFGEVAVGERRFADIGGVRTFELGTAGGRTVILPGLPINADTWTATLDHLPGARAVDLPGLGMSTGTPSTAREWLEALLAQNSTTHLVGHSIGAAAALEAAAAQPDAVAHLTLVSPFFLQRPAPLSYRIPPLAETALRLSTPRALSRMLTGSDTWAQSLSTSADDLRRGTARAAASLLAQSARPRRRAELRALLARFEGTVQVITGGDDPLAPEALELLATLPRVRIETIPGAGHHPQVSHASDVAALIRAAAPQPSPA